MASCWGLRQCPCVSLRFPNTLTQSPQGLDRQLTKSPPVENPDRKFSNRRFGSRQTMFQRVRGQANTSGKGPDDPSPDNKEDSNKIPTNWDGAWSSFKKSIQGGQKQMESYVERPKARPPPKFARSQKEDETRKIENSALNVWTDERFFKVGLAVLGLFLVYIVIVIGPPPPH